MKGLEAIIGAYNVFNKRFHDPTSAEDIAEVVSIPQYRRSCRAKLAYRF